MLINNLLFVGEVLIFGEYNIKNKLYGIMIWEWCYNNKIGFIDEYIGIKVW